jgi:hypothetical protein
MGGGRLKYDGTFYISFGACFGKVNQCSNAAFWLDLILLSSKCWLEGELLVLLEKAVPEYCL